MTDKEFIEARKDVSEVIALVLELKEKDPSTIEKLTWFLKGMSMAKPS